MRFVLSIIFKWRHFHFSNLKISSLSTLIQVLSIEHLSSKAIRSEFIENKEIFKTAITTNYPQYPMLMFKNRLQDGLQFVLNLKLV